MDRKDIVLLGFGGHAKSIIDTIEKDHKYNIIGYTDIEDKGSYRDINWLGTDDNLDMIFKKGTRYAFITVGYMGYSTVREELYIRLKQIGYYLPSIIDNSAIIAKDVSVGEGTFIGKGCIVNSDSSIGKISIVNTASVLEHDNIVGNNVHIAGGSVICGGVHIEDNCMIGANSTIIQNIVVRKKTIMGAGAVVTKDTDGNCTMIGVPAKVIKRG